MNRQKRHWTILVITGVTMLFLILDTKTALRGAQEGIEVSIHTIIPSLFPFIFISAVMSSNLVGRRIPFIRGIGRICGVPDGAESLLLLGLLGGYPVGAQVVSDSYCSGQLDKHSAQRMLGFCNNAGPAFLFGILGPLFSHSAAPYALWLIHIISALLTGILLPGKRRTESLMQTGKSSPLPNILERSVKVISGICGWVVLFRCLIAVCERWFLNLFPVTIKVAFIGLLELSNGCISLASIQSEPVRFILSACILATGGLCVSMQTRSVTRDLGYGMYFPGKVIQTALSLILSLLASGFLYNWGNLQKVKYMFIGILSCVLFISVISYIFMLRRKKGGILQTNGV